MYFCNPSTALRTYSGLSLNEWTNEWRTAYHRTIVCFKPGLVLFSPSSLDAQIAVSMRVRTDSPAFPLVPGPSLRNSTDKHPHRVEFLLAESLVFCRYLAPWGLGLLGMKEFLSNTCWMNCRRQQGEVLRESPWNICRVFRNGGFMFESHGGVGMVWVDAEMSFRESWTLLFW